MDSNLKREIILEHYEHPKNKGLLNDNTYYKANMNNESCIDEIDLMIKVKDGKIIDARFDGEACAMCTSSSSIMIDTIIGKTLDEVQNIYHNFENMIEEKNYDDSVLEQTLVYDDVYRQPSRKKCVLLPWWALRKIIIKIEEDEK